MRDDGFLGALNPGLRSVYESIRKLLCGATRDEARSRYQVGVRIAEVKRAQDKYGTRAVEQLAQALGTNVHTLYRSAAVADCWSPSEFDAVFDRTTAQGQPLCWSHLVLLSGVPSETRTGSSAGALDSPKRSFFFHQYNRCGTSPRLRAYRSSPKPLRFHASSTPRASTSVH